MGKRMLSRAEVAELMGKLRELEKQLEDGLADECASAVVGLTDAEEIERVLREITDRWIAKFQKDVMALVPPEIH